MLELIIENPTKRVVYKNMTVEFKQYLWKLFKYQRKSWYQFWILKPKDFIGVKYNNVFSYDLCK